MAGLNAPEVAAAAEAALAGRLIVIPTDTVYGLGTRPDDPEATSRVFDAKHRPRDLELPVLVPSLAEARRVALVDERAERLVEAYWPGPLTVVLPRTGESEGWALGGENATVGLRMPDHPLARAVLERTGPLAVTSANRSGEPTPSSCDELLAVFGDLVEVYLCEDAPLVGRPSTVVDLAHGTAQVLRPGPLGRSALAAVLAALEDR